MRTGLLRVRGGVAAIGGVLAASLCGAVSAQNVPSVDEVVRNLRGATAAQPAPAPDGLGASKGWTVRPPANPQRPKVAKGSAGGGSVTSPTHAYSETRIQFEFGSDELTADTLRVLDVFARAIATPELADASFVIEGHTDGVGTDAFNLDLSRRRAESVVRYLVEQRGVDKNRLSAVGKGKSELAVSDPASPLNRRVVWITKN